MKRKRNVFSNVGAVRPGRSAFDLSYDVKLTGNMGWLIPVMCDEMVPGDKFTIGNQAVLRFQPLVAPILHEVNVYVHYFFVPYRLLWDDWEDFISGGVDGTFDDPIPRWEPTSYGAYSLWDYFGFPVGVDPDGAYPLDFPRRAYNFVYNEFYRDENLQTEVALSNETILQRSWPKDYFTSALPWQQRGVSPSFPISGVLEVSGQDANVLFDVTGDSGGPYGLSVSASAASPPDNVESSSRTGQPAGFFRWNDPQLEVDLGDGVTVDVADLRLMFQIQKFLERNARAGVRYTEFLRAHFGVSPRDDRLDRPEYVGGTRSPIIMSEVLQTSETDSTPQGNLAGHAISVSSSYAGKCYAPEYGLVIGLLSVMPKAVYQQGINRQWLRETRYDFYFPEFANLSEQAITRAELYASAVSAENTTIFGYQGRYDEMRTKQSMVTSGMRDTYDYWHMSRQFSSAPELNETFILCEPRMDCFAVPTEPAFVMSFGNIIKAVRPMPLRAEPGLIDHF